MRPGPPGARPWLACAAGAVVVGLLGVGAFSLDDSRRELDRTRAALATVEFEASAGRSDVTRSRNGTVRVRQHRVAAGAAVTGAHQERGATEAEVAARTTERDSLATTLGSTTAELADARGSLATAEERAGVQGVRIATLQECLGGVAHATAAAAADRRDEAVAALRAASGACTATTASLGPPGGAAPVFPLDFADPFVLRAGGRYYAYATNGGGGEVQLMASSDLRTWEWLGDALAELPPWAASRFTWAPSVLARGSSFVLYYAAADRASGDQCISRAVADSPRGPFVDRSAGPLVCQHDQGGSIDPSPFVDADGTAYLTWKSEGETAGGTARIWAQRLSGDGRSLAGSPVELLRADQPWEGGVVEGPSVLREGGTYHLFYSANSWNSGSYGVGHAVCRSPAGPCTKSGTGPVLASSGRTVGPGGQEFFRDADGRTWASFHAWVEPDVGFPSLRRLHLRRLTLVGGRPRLTSR